MESFQGFDSGGYFWRRVTSRSKRAPTGVRVRTFAEPMTALAFVAITADRRLAVTARDSDRGAVPILDASGALARGAVNYLARLASDEEALILRLFGTDLADLSAV